MELQNGDHCHVRSGIPTVTYTRETASSSGQWTSKYHPDHGVSESGFVVLERLGVPRALLSQHKYARGETKCIKGQACRGEMGEDRRKWLAAAEEFPLDSQSAR